MAGNKNQHFVPQFLLRRFSCDEEKKFCFSCNRTSGKIHKPVSISDQASKPYFYGKDLIVERQLHSLEGKYASLFRDIEDNNEISDKMLFTLTQFFVLQQRRTRSSREDTNFLIEELEKKQHFLFNGIEKEKFMEEQKNINIDEALKIHLLELDLARYIVSNRTDIPFIIGDSPVIESNLYFSTRNKLISAGLGQIGFQTFVPISPQTGILMQDRTAYAIRNKKVVLPLHKEEDVMHLNYLQAANCRDNVYYNHKLTDKTIELIKNCMNTYSRPEPVFNDSGDSFFYQSKKSPFPIKISQIIQKRNNNLTRLGFVPRSPKDPRFYRDRFWFKIIDEFSGKNTTESIWTFIDNHELRPRVGSWFTESYKEPYNR